MEVLQISLMTNTAYSKCPCPNPCIHLLLCCNLHRPARCHCCTMTASSTGSPLLKIITSPTSVHCTAASLVYEGTLVTARACTMSQDPSPATQSAVCTLQELIL